MTEILKKVFAVAWRRIGRGQQGSEAERERSAWPVGGIAEEIELTPRLRQGAGRYPRPIALLARLGVDQAHEGHGLGAGLLRDVIQRVATLSEEIGCRGLLVHCESAVAKAFYLHLIPELEASPTDELHLVLLLKDIKQTLRAQRR